MQQLSSHPKIAYAEGKFEHPAFSFLYGPCLIQLAEQEKQTLVHMAILELGRNLLCALLSTSVENNSGEGKTEVLLLEMIDSIMKVTPD